jgi:hypothetical protein
MGPNGDTMGSRTSLALALVAAALVSGARHACADTVFLTDGRRVQGRSSIEGDEVVVQQKFGEVRFARALVSKIVKEDDVYSELERKQKDLGAGTADERYSLGVWCREKGFDAEARAAFLSVLKLDPDHGGARAALGYVRDEGRWITEDDLMRSKGLVKFDGRWMTPTDKVKLEAEQAHKRELAREAAKKAEDEKEAKRRAKLDAEREARDARMRAYEDELARERARLSAEDPGDGFGLRVYDGPIGPYGCYYGPAFFGGYWAGPVPSTNDILAYAGVRSGRFRYPTRARPFLGRVVTYGTFAAPDYLDGGFGTASGFSERASSSFGFGASLSGTWTSRSGRAQVRVRVGF